MRRGHPGIGGWRNENPRHFRPRNGGNQHFRPSRGYGLLDQHRFPPPGSRPHRPSHPYHQRSGADEHVRRDHHHDRGKFRSDYRHNYGRNHEDNPKQEKTIYPKRNNRQTETPYSNNYPKEPPHYYEGSSKHCHMNNMGDIDDRYIPPRTSVHPISPWAHDIDINQFDDRHKFEHSKTHNYDTIDTAKLPLHDYPGHRPPSSDHYGGNPTPVINNSESFNRSVDDTVNIIRKRLLNRNDPPLESNDCNFDHPVENQAIIKTECNQSFQREQPMKKKVHRQRSSEKSRCGASFTKIKSKIVNQLFKMDKEKIHKLMDNPNSSSKFEYAISSLITESQYSFNRHLRSIAEKSLHTSSSIDFIQNDNNTIYEDTFMKQMQCILDPQDTILLEDIKPIVMAELSKALQLDEYEHRLEAGDEEVNHQQSHEQPNYSNEYYINSHSFDNYPQYSPEPDQKLPLTNVDFRDSSPVQETNSELENNHERDFEDDTYFQSRSRRRSRNLSHERVATIERKPHTRKSLDERLNELQFATIKEPEHENPLFDTKPDSQSVFVPNVESNLEDDDDPFAELDKQYHVAVDPSFINNEDSPNSHLENDDDLIKINSNTNMTLNLNVAENENHNIKQEIDHQLQNMASSPLKFSSHNNNHTKTDDEVIKNLHYDKRERKYSDDNLSSHITHITYVEKTARHSSEEHETKKMSKENDQSDNSHDANKSAATLSSRKRSVDQSPSHRKEKRKKSDSVHIVSDKQIHNRHTVINAHESTSKLSTKDDKKTFSEKHTKRKESQKKTDQKDNEPRKKVNSENFKPSVIHKEINNTATNNNKIHNKSECKTTLKTFDIFTEHPKKTNMHQAYRNTALPVADNIKSIPQSKTKNVSKIEKKTGPPSFTQDMKKFVSKEIQTMEVKPMHSRFSQTEKKKLVTKATQTDTLCNTKNDSLKSTDALERMKEIDLEIQVLLQEKFKLYSSIESRETSSNSLHTLGMAVVNVSPSEDSIVDDFTSIPVEELEQIALESVEVNQAESLRPETRNKRLRALDKEKSKSQSPVPATQKRNNKKGKPTNVITTEQLESDHRPIDEDIISIDDIEETSVRSRGVKVKSKKRVTRRGPVRSKEPIPTESNDFVLKECVVLIVREDFSKYLPDIDTLTKIDSSINNECIIESCVNLPEEPIVNDIHFDMLDVSEDIVIGDVCEFKTIADKASDAADIPTNEEIILDNSQSSIEEQQGSSSESKENECKVFDYSADDNLRRDSIVVTGNADAVLAVECIENNFIAACLDGNVYYFGGDGQLISTLRGSNLAVTCLTIVKEKYGTTVYTGSLDSRIRYYDLDTGLEKGPECNVLSPIQTMDRAWDTVFVGTRTGFVLQFECKNNMLIPVSTVQFSDQSILALRAMKEGPRKVLLVAARSEDVTIKDAQTGLLLRTLVGPKMTVYTLLYEDGKVYCGTSSSQIHVFDYSSGSHVGAHEGGKGAVCLRAAGGLLFAGCYDGCVYVYREGERRPFAQLRGPSLMLLSLAVVGSKIIAGYKDRSLYIWKIPLSILQEMIL